MMYKDGNGESILMSVHGHGVTDVKLVYMLFIPFINELLFIWKNFELRSLLKFLGGGQTINDEDKNSGI